jgi:hypothetical protein
MSDQRTINFQYAPSITFTSICRPDDFYKTLVRDDGSLLYGFRDNGYQARHFERVIEFGIQAAHAPVRVSQNTESARVPVVVTMLEYARATLELRAFAHVHDGDLRSDVVLWTIRANNDVDEILTGIKLDAYERRCIFIGRNQGAARAIYAVDPDMLPSDMSSFFTGDDSHTLGELALISTPQGLIQSLAQGFRPASGLKMEPVILRGGESVSGALIFPLNYHHDAGMDDAWAADALESERAFWNDYPLLALPWEIPDPAVMDMLTACARNILQAREIEEGLPTFQVGATDYRGLWVVDGHFILEAARYLGYGDEASAAIDTLLNHVRPDGAISIMEHHTKETGISITTLVRQTELSGDEERLRALWSTVQNAVGYIEGLRASAKALPSDHPSFNLLPDSFGDGGMWGERGEYTTAVWILAGLKTAASAARNLGFVKDAERFQADFDSLMADFRAHTVRNMRVLPDGTPYLPQWFPESDNHHQIPGYPNKVEPWHQLRPESATWAFCQSIYPGEIFAPDDPFVQNFAHLLDLLDDEQGIPANTGWLPYKALWTYYASFAAHVWLYSGRGDKAVDYLYAFANHASTTRVWREEQSLTASENGQFVGDMPHNWASAEFVRLLRHLLVFERGDMLELLPGLPKEWIRSGAVIRLEDTPTRFGPVSLRLTSSDGAHLQIEITVDPSWARQPTQRWLHLPRAVEITVNDVPTTPAADGRLPLPNVAHMRITARLT